MSAQSRAATVLRDEVLALRPYHVPSAAGLIKLDAMENPYRWPPELTEQWLGRLRHAELNRYPAPQAPELTERLREAMQIPAQWRVMLGNGSDELIQLLAMAVAKPGAKLLSVEPTFVMYAMIARYLGIEYVGVPLREDFTLDLDATLATIAAEQPALIFLAWPNNPTGNLFPVEQLEAIIAAAPGLVVIDEAYEPFAGQSLLGRIGEFDNVVVLRTVSKMGLAGLRLGYLVGAPAWLDPIDGLRLPYNINVLTQITASFALEHKPILDAQAAQLREARTVLSEQLQALDSIRVYPSAANFILIRCLGKAADAVHGELREAGVLIKNLHGSAPALDQCLRVTVSTAQENEAFIEALREALSG